MKAEITSRVNAVKSEHYSEKSGYHSGYRVRRFDSRMGIVSFPSCGTEGIYTVLCKQEKVLRSAPDKGDSRAYINRVSTRNVEKLAKSLGIDSISLSQVSQIRKELKDQVSDFK